MSHATRNRNRRSKILAMLVSSLTLALFACNAEVLDAGGQLKDDPAAVEPGHARDVTADPSQAGHTPSPPRAVDQEASAGADEGKLLIDGTLTGAALRYEGWASTNGNVSFGFNWPRIHAGSHVYISASEVDNAGNRFMGAANYTVANVVVKEGRVEFRVAIGWGSPLRVSTDILTVDP